MWTEDVLTEAAVRYNIFYMVSEGRDLRAFSRVNFLCLNFKPERAG